MNLLLLDWINVIEIDEGVELIIFRFAFHIKLI